MTEDQDITPDLLARAAELVITNQYGNASMLQSGLRVGPGTSGALMERLEDLRIVGPSQGHRSRDVLVPVKDAPRVADRIRHPEQAALYAEIDRTAGHAAAALGGLAELYLHHPEMDSRVRVLGAVSGDGTGALAALGALLAGLGADLRGFETPDADQAADQIERAAALLAEAGAHARFALTYLRDPA